MMRPSSLYPPPLGTEKAHWPKFRARNAASRAVFSCGRTAPRFFPTDAGWVKEVAFRQMPGACHPIVVLPIWDDEGSIE